MPEATISAEKVSAALKAMTPEMLQKIKLEAIKAGIPLSDPNTKFRKLGDGNVQVLVTIPAEIWEPMSEWDRSGLSEEEFLQGQVVEALQNTVYGAWQQQTREEPGTAVPTVAGLKPNSPPTPPAPPK